MLHQRYLVSFDPHRILHRLVDVVVVGAGVAGLRAAVEVAEANVAVAVLCKGKVREANTERAQGGIAVVIDPERTGDDPESHVRDTLECGRGLCDERVVRLTVTEGIDRVRELIEWGARFDSKNGKLDLGKEGGHSFNRIVHAQGDATGREILSTLLRRARGLSAIELIEHTFVLDLLVREGRCVGVLAWHPRAGLVAFWAKAVILACGGYGRLYRETTNGPHATGDGVAMAWRAGATVENLEFVQFHPTTLYVAGADRWLITEAARGEGGKLIDHTGTPFMDQYHPMGELGPRDAVARAIIQHMKKTGQPMVYLDLRHLGRERLAQRFPGICQICRQYDLDPARDPIPVRPSAHYTIGGVKTDSDGATDLPGLFACGETASTGLHGANRLASNSLLEGLVFGRRSARAALREVEAQKEPRVHLDVAGRVEGGSRPVDTQDLRRSLMSLMVRQVGITRSREELAEARKDFYRWAQYVGEVEFHEIPSWEVQNMLVVALLVAESSLWRRESRGVHWREDFPGENPAFSSTLEVARRSEIPSAGQGEERK